MHSLNETVSLVLSVPYPYSHHLKRFCVDDKARGPLVFQMNTFSAILNTSFTLSPPNNRSEVPVVTPLPGMPSSPSLPTRPITDRAPHRSSLCTCFRLPDSLQSRLFSIPGLGKLQHRPNLVHCLFSYK